MVGPLAWFAAVVVGGGCGGDGGVGEEEVVLCSANHLRPPVWPLLVGVFGNELPKVFIRDSGAVVALSLIHI